MGDAKPADYWPESGQAVAYLARVQKLLDARGLTGREPHLKPLMKKVTAAFKARNLADFNAACDALVDAIEGDTKGQKESVAKKGKGKK
jgi:hypothetical protein